MSNQVANVLGPGGLLSQAFQGYQPRSSQIEMALSVEWNAEDGGRLMIEAPTGVGKSLGYLVPLIPFAQKGERVMVCTSSIVLQEQIVGKDLPLLARILPEPFTFALAKGINNYLCKNEYEDFAGEVAMVGSRDPEIVAQWPKIQEWAESTIDGDVSELPFELDSRVRLKVTTTSDDCLGRKCAHYDDCYGRLARERAKRAQVVVTNYHLFFADLAVKTGDPQAGPLPSYKHVVFDEAHDAAEIARDFFGFRVSPGVIKRATRFLSGHAKHGIPPLGDKELRIKVQHASEEFFEEVSAFYKRRDYAGRLECAGAFDPTRLNQVLSEVSRAYGDAFATHNLGANSAAALLVAGGMEKLGLIRSQLEYAAALHEPTRFVYFLEPSPPAIAMKPIDVGPMLDKHLFQRQDVKSVVMTSATLASGSREGERFDFFEQEIGVTKADELVVDSPFDFANNVLLYLPKPMHSPNEEQFPSEVAEVCWDIAQAAGGRTLCLFTSFKILEETVKTFRRRGAPWKLLVHREAPRMQLIEQFKADETSILFGCESFWQGVDVPGPALSAVVMDKIPFAHHDDPVMGAVAAMNKNWFGERALPQAVIAMKQGFGRLIRASSDRGVVAVCDPRLRTKGYGKKITKSLPAGLPSTSNLADVRAFLARARGEDVHAAPTDPDDGDD